MITTKERASLKGLAHKLKVSVQVGKEGITDTVLNEIDVALFNKELIKVKLLKTADLDKKDAMHQIGTKLNAEEILVVGNILVLYRFSDKEGVEHINF
ncbi:MAG: YhbY family RNA-binding protein [Spirochaetales bacterium]